MNIINDGDGNNRKKTHESHQIDRIYTNYNSKMLMFSTENGRKNTDSRYIQLKTSGNLIVIYLQAQAHIHKLL